MTVEDDLRGKYTAAFHRRARGGKVRIAATAHAATAPLDARFVSPWPEEVAACVRFPNTDRPTYELLIAADLTLLGVFDLDPIPTALHTVACERLGYDLATVAAAVSLLPEGANAVAAVHAFLPRPFPVLAWDTSYQTSTEDLYETCLRAVL